MLRRPALRSAGARGVPLRAALVLRPKSSALSACRVAPGTCPKVAVPTSRVYYPGTSRCASTTSTGPSIWWRGCTTSEEFVQKAGWSPKDTEAFCATYPSNSRNPWRQGGQWLDIAANEIGTAIAHENPAFSWSDWRTIVYTKPGFEDLLVDLLIQMWPYRGDPTASFRIVSSLLYIDERLEGIEAVKRFQQDLAQAFEQEQLSSLWRELPSIKLDSAITECYMNHKINPTRYISPVTTLIGPEGIGKSYTAVQLGITQGLWLSYTSFVSGADRETFPLRSPMADLLINAKEEVWISYFLFQILVVQAVSSFQICASGNARLQYHEAFRSIRQRLANTFTRMAGDLRISVKEDTLKSVRDRFPQQYVEILAIVKPVRQILDASGWNGRVVKKTSARKNLRNILFLDDFVPKNGVGGISQASIAALHRAAQALFLSIGHTDPFFVVMATNAISALEQAIQMQEFTHGDAHPPLFRLPTYDVYATDELVEDITKPKNADGSPQFAAEMFKKGRPLWGALLASSDTVTAGDVLRVASRKLQWRGHGLPSRAFYLALLRTRLHFDVLHPGLKEEMTSDWLNYTIRASRKREYTETSQPSEPVLAHASAQHLTNMHMKISAAQALINCIHDRTISVANCEEATAGLILLFAVDRLLDPVNTLPKAFGTIDYVEALLGGEFLLVEKELWRLNNSVRHGRIFFNHFTRAVGELTEEHLKEAYSRGAALYLPRQLGGGFLIPVSMNGGYEMSGIIVRMQSNGRLDMGFMHKELACLKSKSVINITMDFNPELGEITLSKSQLRPVETQMRLRSVNMTRSSDSVYDLHIYVPGLSTALYPALRVISDSKLVSSSTMTGSERLTEKALLSTLRRLSTALATNHSVISQDRFAGPLVDLSARVAASRSQREVDKKAEGERKAAEVERALVLARRENRKQKKKRIREVKALVNKERKEDLRREYNGEVSEDM